MAESLQVYPTSKFLKSARRGDVAARRRKSIRLPGFDYSQPGAYFITVCTRNRACILGDVTEGKLRLSAAGRLAQAVWEELPQHYPHVQLDAWTVMPNHVHGIVILDSGPAGPVGAGLKPAPTEFLLTSLGPV